MRIVFASDNEHKYLEISAALESSEIYIIPQRKFSVSNVEETGKTFVENAILKARNASQKSGLPALADDSGLVVDALGGRPGGRSARFAGKEASDGDNIEKLLEEMSDCTVLRRSCHFICVLVFLQSADDPMPKITEGLWRGTILFGEIMQGGFGYDSVFFDTEVGKVASQMTRVEKNALSHRGKAIKKMKKFLIDQRSDE